MGIAINVHHGSNRQRRFSFNDNLILPLFFTFLPLLIWQSVSGQSRLSDTIRIEEVSIAGLQATSLAGLRQVVLDSNLLNYHSSGGLDEVLSSYALVQIKRYGPGSVSSPSFRGAGPSHTRILWNGISINSAMLGQADVSLIPAFFCDEVLISHTGVSPGNPSGSLGGSIHFSGKADWINQKKIWAGYQAGSYSSHHNQARLQLGSPVFQSDSRLIITNSGYTSPRPGLVPQTGKSGFELFALHQDFHFRIRSNQFFHAALWGQKRNHSAGFSNGARVETQKENFLRSMMEWKIYSENHHLAIRTSWMINQMDYEIITGSESILHSKHQLKTNIIALDHSLNPGRPINWVSGLHLESHRAETDSYSGKTSRSDASFYSGMHYHSGRFLGYVLNKILVTHQQIIPWIPTLGAEYSFPKKDISLKANLSMNYQRPSMNDLYWNDDGYSKGNPNLSPESGLSAEGGAQWNQQTLGGNFGTEITLFASQIKDWITWQPDSTGKWSPRNLDGVIRKGIEGSFFFRHSCGHWKMESTAGYSFLLAHPSGALESGSSTKLQLMYVPRHTANLTIKIIRGNFNLLANTQYTGKRFTTTDHSDWIQSYLLHHLKIENTFFPFGRQISLMAGVQNILDKKYESTRGYPMPGRNWIVGLNIMLEKPAKPE